MFIENKYKTWHDNIISKAKLRTEERIYEIHHIIPKCLKGSNDKSNLVKLTPKEHYIVHMLLCKFTKGYARHKMIFAFQAMANIKSKNRTYKVNSKTAELLKLEFRKLLTGRKLSKKTLAKLSKIRKGRKLTEEHKRKIGLAGLGRKVSKETILKITSKTKAIITVSLYGLSPEYDEILEICKEYNIFLIEDNAECFLGYYKGKLVGTFGDFSSYSFQASKHISCGEGGMLTTNDPKLADIARRFTSLGYAGVSGKQAKITRNDIQDPKYNRHISVGFNYRMSEVQSAVMLGQLERIEELVDIRVKVGEIFDEAVEGSDIVTKQYTPEYCKNSYWGYALVLNTDNPEVDWYKFRDLFQKNGGDGYYAAWKLTYQEDLFTKVVVNICKEKA